jgi:hypothetical protein
MPKIEDERTGPYRTLIRLGYTLLIETSPVSKTKSEWMNLRVAGSYPGTDSASRTKGYGRPAESPI